MCLKRPWSKQNSEKEHFPIACDNIVFNLAVVGDVIMNAAGEQSYSESTDWETRFFFKEVLDTVQWSSRLWRKMHAFNLQERKNAENGKRGRGNPEGEWRAREGRRARTALLFIHFWTFKKHTIALRLQQPTAYKPMSEEGCQTLFHTESSDPLSQRPAVQCYALNCSPVKELVVSMCKLQYQEGDKPGSSHCPYLLCVFISYSALLFKESILSFSVEQ